MTTRRKRSNGIGSMGVHHVGKIVGACNSLFQPIDHQEELGNDAYIEFVIDEASTGCCIAAQIKSGPSYVRNGTFAIPSDEKHFGYWRSHVLPVCGVVHDPRTDTARRVDITAYLASIAETPASYTIRVPDHNVFDEANFTIFRDHFLAYRTRFSTSAHFGSSLADFSHLDDLPRCRDSIRALFSFHRNRVETWYFVISCINNFRSHPLLRSLVAILSHVPGHMDILWGPKSIISESVCKEAEALLKRLLTRDTVLTLVSSIGSEGGIERGSIGQCVDAIVALAPQKRTLFESIISDRTIQETERYWVVLLLIANKQRRHADYCIEVLNRALPYFSDENQEMLRGLRDTLREHGVIPFS